MRSAGRPVFRLLGRVERGADDGFAHHLAGFRGFFLFAFSSISCARSSWSRLPQFTPMRTGLP